MKILLVTDGLPPLVLGGTGNIVMQIAKGLSKNGHDVSTLSFSDKPKQSKQHFELPARSTRWMHYRSVFSKKREQEVLRVIETVKPDIIHAHTIANQAGYRWIKPARERDIEVIMTAHDVVNVACGRVTGFEKALWLKDLLRCKWSWNPFRTSIIRKTLNQHVKVLTVSDALREFMTRNGFTNLTTVHNGIDTNFWKPEDQKKIRTTLDLPYEKTMFFLAGRLGIDKGTDLIVKTLPKDAHLIIAGRAHLPNFAPVKDRLHYFANQGPAEMRDLYAACDAVLVPSRCLDCFPTMCLEGMSCERAILATSWGGSKEAVIDGKTGWVMDPMNEAAWAEKMQWCVEQRSTLGSVGKEGRKHMIKSFALPTFLDELENMYNSLIR